MIPRRLVLAAPVVAALTLVACADDPRPAATVDGTPITQQAVADELAAIRDNTTYVEAIESGGQPVLGENEDDFDSDFVAEQVAVRIQYAIVGNEVDRRDLEVDDECRAAARDTLVGRLAGASSTGDGAAVLDSFPAAYQDYLVDREADVLLLQGDLMGQPCVAEDAVGEYFAEHEDEFLQACAAHILVATREEADEIVELLRGGADFATLATERSLDTGSAPQGGELPCATRGQFVAAFDEAVFTQPIGEIGEPVQTEIGFHVIRVDAFEEPELDEVRDQVANAITAEVQQTFGTWFTGALADADVEVDARYGTWDPGTASIVRPDPETSSTTSTTAAEG